MLHGAVAERRGGEHLRDVLWARLRQERVRQVAAGQVLRQFARGPGVQGDVRGDPQAGPVQLGLHGHLLQHLVCDGGARAAGGAGAGGVRD